MYELPLMGHTLVAYCWGGKSQNIEGALKTNLKTFFFIRTRFLVCCFPDLWSSVTDTKLNLKDKCFCKIWLGVLVLLNHHVCTRVSPCLGKMWHGMCVQSKNSSAICLTYVTNKLLMYCIHKSNLTRHEMTLDRYVLKYAINTKCPYSHIWKLNWGLI